MPSNHDAKLPEITSESEEGFVDLIFHIEEYESRRDGSQSIKAAGLHEKRRVGVELILGSSWEPSALGTDVPLIVYRGEVSYRRVGPESDAFLRVLDTLYGTGLGPKGMGAETPFTGISLEGEPGDLAKGPVKIKLFYEKGGEEAYAELYTNIDLRSRRLEVREKDTGYRKQIVRALRGE